MASFAVDAKQRVALNPKIPQCFPERLKLAIPPPGNGVPQRSLQILRFPSVF